MAETEAILLRRFARSGDAEAFAEIIRRYAGLVYGAALRVLADVDRASDVAQDTFLQLAKDAGNVTGSLPGWLHRVATHKAIDQVRRDVTRRRREAEYTVARPEEERTDWREISPYVDEGLNLLDPHLRSILISHFLEGRSTREIARAQGVSQATISRRIETGVELLRAGLRRRGILVAAGMLSLLLGENAVEAAPPMLLTELGKIALISGSLAASTTTAGTAFSLGDLAAGALTGVKANLVAVATAAVVVIGAGSVVTYRHFTRPAGREASVALESAEQRAFEAGPTATPDSSAQAGMPSDAQGVASGGPSEDAAGQRPPFPVRQGVPGPEAETDPRTYTGPRGEGSVVANAADPSLLRGTPDQPSLGTGVDSGQASLPLGSASDGLEAQAGPRIAESPYETVVRLRREAASGTPGGFVDPDLAADFTVGAVVAKAELQFMPPFRGSPVGMMGFQQQGTTTVKPAKTLETPPDAPREPVYFVVHAGGREIQGITYRSIRSPGEVMMILDTDDDGLWSDEKAYGGRRLWMFAMTATYEFGPVYVRQGSTEPGGDSFYARCSDGRWLTFCSAFYRDGIVVLDGRTYRIGLVDSDFDGRFNEPFSPSVVHKQGAGCDMLAIDLNGDSQFIRRPLDEPEVMPLGRLIRVAGRYYGIEVGQDGGSIEFRQAELAPGRSDLDKQDSRL
jgi:RNA polymerase sigma-70 factor (ECF subfamily)